eukprot:Skav226111  [mRNA]  locus=scaffold702:154023:158627:- [translate_table: standard]
MVEFHRVPLNSSGRYKGLPAYEPNFDEVHEGARVSMKLRVLVHTPGKHLCLSMIAGKVVALEADIEHGIHEVSVLFAKIYKGKHGYHVKPDEHSHVLQLRQVTSDNLLHLKELCAGVGGLGVGAEFSGFKVTACVEKQPRFCELLSKLTDASVVPGDMSWLSTVASLHEADPEPSMLGMGFNCQSFSKGGDQQGGWDQRAMTLPWGLWIAYMLNCSAVVLECVAEAPGYVFVRKSLEQFQEISRAHLSEVILQLSDLWPSSRKRWWAVLTPQHVGQVQLAALPKLTRTPVVSDVLTAFRCKSSEIQEQLEITQEELQLLQALGTDLDKCSAQLHESLPTALHSWANQLIPCKCQCRPHALGMSRLRERGFFGTLIKCRDASGAVKYRHPSASEVGLLVGWPKAMGISDARLEVSAMGQIASPVQSTWIFSLIKDHLAKRGLGDAPIVPVQEGLSQLLAKLITLRNQEFGSPNLANQTFEQELHLRGIKRPHSAVEAASIPGAVPGFSWPVQAPVVTSEVAPSGPSEEVSSVVDKEEQATCEPEPPTEEVRTPSDVPSASEADSTEGRVDNTQPCPSAYGILFDGVGVGPQDLLAGRTVICDVANDSAFAVDARVSTINQFLSAQYGEEAQHFRVFTAVGREVDPSTRVADWECLVVQHNDFAGEASHGRVTRCIESSRRVMSVLQQGGWVSDDEMQFYLSGFQSKQEASVVAPLLLSQTEDWDTTMQQWFSEIQAQPAGITVSAILHNDHWIPVIIDWDAEMKFRTTPEGRDVLNMSTCPVASTIITFQMQGAFANDCGFQTIGWLSYHLGLQTTHAVLTPRDAEAWRFLWWQQVAMARSFVSEGPIMIGGHLPGSDELHTAIAAILREHGVAIEQVNDRTSEVIAKIGRDELKKAIHSSRPWAQLKQQANRCQPPLQLVLPSELDAVVKSRLVTGNQFGKKKNKMQTKTSVSELHPSDLHVPPGVFVLADGSPVHQVELRQIKKTSHGLVVCLEHEVEAMIGQCPLTEGGLLLLVLNPTEEFVKRHGQILRFPAQCTSTSEPVLVSAVPVQAGQAQVSRARPTAVPQVGEVKVITLKVLWYRDQCSVAWQDVIEAPVRHLMTKLKCLTECKHPGCSCEAWHRGPSQDPLDQTEPIMDLWNRDFLNLSFRKVKATEAQMFVCQMRVREDRFQVLLQQIGQEGVFVEPRTPDGRTQNPDWQTIWLPKHDLPAANVASAKCQHVNFVIRVNRRYGLKVQTKDASVVHQMFRSDTPFLGEGETSIFQLGPLPWGTTRTSLQQLFTSWEWKAVPLQPIGRSACNRGLLWAAKAAGPPAASVLTLAHGDIIIVRKETEAAKTYAIPQVEASMHTKQHLASPESFDPWADAASQLPGTKVQRPGNDPHVTQKQLQNLEDRLVRQIKEAAKPTPADTDAVMTEGDMEPRVKALEERVASIGVLQQQQVEQTQNLQQQVDSQGKSMQQHLDLRLTQQMERIEELFKNKRGKYAADAEEMHKE